jgi:hypothetical protein
MRTSKTIRSSRLMAQCGNVQSIAYVATHLCARLDEESFAEQTPDYSRYA